MGHGRDRSGDLQALFVLLRQGIAHLLVACRLLPNTDDLEPSMIDQMFNSGAIPVLERSVEFTEARHQVLADDIANLDTPYFKPRDLDPDAFQTSLRNAIAARRETATPETSALGQTNTDQVSFSGGRIHVNPKATNSNILFHDRNNRNLERIMEHLAQNSLMHKTGIDMLKNEFSMLNTAISGRV